MLVQSPEIRALCMHHGGVRDGEIKPLGNRILVERLEGHGIEETTACGIILPATRESRARFKGDYFRARVKAIGTDVRLAPGELEPGHEVLVYEFGGDKLYTGEGTTHGLFVTLDDIVCAVDPEEAAS
jgi:co-chaperonin GroES (HSP10)